MIVRGGGRLCRRRPSPVKIVFVAQLWCLMFVCAWSLVVSRIRDVLSTWRNQAIVILYKNYTCMYVIWKWNRPCFWGTLLSPIQRWWRSAIPLKLTYSETSWSSDGFRAFDWLSTHLGSRIKCIPKSPFEFATNWFFTGSGLNVARNSWASS